MSSEILTLDQVIKLTNLSRSTIFRLESTFAFPSRIKLSKRRIGWMKNDIFLWISNLKSEVK